MKPLMIRILQKILDLLLHLKVKVIYQLPTWDVIYLIHGGGIEKTSEFDKMYRKQPGNFRGNGGFS